MYDKAAFIAVCCTAYNLKPTSMNDFIGFINAIAKANFPRCANCFRLRASFTLGAIPLFLATCYPCPFVLSVGNVPFSHGFHRFHGFGYTLCMPICGISGKCSFLPRISQICTDLVTCYLCPFVSSVGIFFLPRISLICTDLIINYPWVLCLWVK